MNPAYVNDWQITYLFAITNKTTDTQLDNLVKYVSDPLKDCDGQSLVVRILARNNSDSDWMTDVNKVGPYLEQLRNDEVLIAGVAISDLAANIRALWKRHEHNSYTFSEYTGHPETKNPIDNVWRRNRLNFKCSTLN
uniref:Uncharacterized protein n=1 Tax=Caenorhabditis japonica TaxID=281687 RepID=A0A8R1IX85_CAEJA